MCVFLDTSNIPIIYNRERRKQEEWRLYYYLIPFHNKERLTSSLLCHLVLSHAVPISEMSGDKLMFDEFITLCDEQYEYGLIEFKNGDIINGPGENDGSAKVLSYAALAEFDKETTLKVCFVCMFCLHFCFRVFNFMLHACVKS